MKGPVALFLVLALAGSALGQPSSRTGTKTKHPSPALVVQRDGKAEPLGLVRLEIGVRIAGFLAETSATMTFANPGFQQAEGDLCFPLPPGATVSGYALDINGEMVDGVAVPRQCAREVFEAEKNRRVDPGLVEWSGENWFRTRVFPIPARGERTVRVRYLSELVDEPGGRCFCLPLDFSRSVRDFSLRIEAVAATAEPKVRQSPLGDFRFAKLREGFLGETKLKDAALSENLVVSLPETDTQEPLVEWSDGGEVYFAVQDRVPAPLPKPGDQGNPPPAYVALYWDASGSRSTDDQDHWLEIGLVKSLLTSWTAPDSGGSGKVEVELQLLRNKLSTPRRFVITRTNIAELITALESVEYDGGTQLGAISAPGGYYDMALLFSDGISTFGSDTPASPGKPLYCISADAGADAARLRQLAASNGGQYFDLLRQNDTEIVAAIRRPGCSLLSTTVERGRVADLLPTHAQPVAGRLTLVGRLETPQAVLALRYDQVDHWNRSFKLDRRHAVYGDSLRRYWAEKKLQELSVCPQQNKNEIVTLAEQYGLVTPFTSLMVLENLGQYVQYRIEPPKSQPGMRDQYRRMVGQQEKQQETGATRRSRK